MATKTKDDSSIKATQTKNQKEEEIMPTFSLGGQQYQIIRFTVPPSRKPGVHYIVESQFAIAVYLVDKEGLDDFEDDRPFAYFSGYKNRRYFDEEIDLPNSGRWHLIIWNTNNNPTAIHYELYV